MRIFSRLGSWFRSVTRRADWEREMADELHFHLDQETADLVRHGLTPLEASRRARVAFGAFEGRKDDLRDAVGLRLLDEGRADLRYAWRQCRASRAFTLATVLLMALSIAAMTTMFSVVYGVLLRPLPWPQSERLVRVEERRGDRPGRIPSTLTNATYLAWRDQPETIVGLGGWSRIRATVTTGADTPRVVAAAPVTPDLFRAVIPARPELGRLLADDDVTVGAAATGVLVSFGFWQERLGGRDDAIGHVIGIDGRPHRIVGVMPREFVFPDGEVQAWPGLQVVPVAAPNGTRAMIFYGLARLRPGATADQASAEATSRARAAPDIGSAALGLFGSRGVVTVAAYSALDVAVADVRPALLILLAAVGLLFATATASIVSVQLARATKRRREMAVRAALGATTARVTRQWCVESGLVAFAGGLGGVVLTLALHRASPILMPAEFPRLDDIAVDWRVLWFAAAITVVAAVVSALPPAFASARVTVTEAYSGAAPPAGRPVRTRSARTRQVLIAAQIAIAAVLLVGGGLLARSFVSLIRADRGYDVSHLMTAGLAFPRAYPPVRRVQLLEQLQQRLRAVPGITHAAFGIGWVWGRRVPSPSDPAVSMDIEGYLHAVSPDYLSAVGARVLSGRPLNAADTETAPPVVLVDRSFAARYLGAHPVGQMLRLNIGNHPMWQVVGVIEDMEGGGVGVSSDPFAPPAVARLYTSYRQSELVPAIVFAIRFTTAASSIGPAVRQLLQEQDSSLAFDSISTMEDQISRSLGRPRAYALLISGFALFAVTIAGVGLFGVLSHMTSQRTREIGIRTALGATALDVIRLVVGQALITTVSGLIAGLLTAYVAAESLAHILYGVTPHDTFSFTVVPIFLIGVAAAASALPAWRAARLDPLRALRVD